MSPKVYRPVHNHSPKPYVRIYRSGNIIFSEALCEKLNLFLEKDIDLVRNEDEQGNLYYAIRTFRGSLSLKGYPGKRHQLRVGLKAFTDEFFRDIERLGFVRKEETHYECLVATVINDEDEFLIMHDIRLLPPMTGEAKE